MKWNTERHFKPFIVLVSVVFVALQIPFSIAWIHQQHGIWGANDQFWHQVFHDPLYQVTVVDFTTVAFLVFVWMVWDGQRRQHPWRAWLWFLPFMISPSVGLLGYLLTRKGVKFPAD